MTLVRTINRGYTCKKSDLSCKETNKCEPIHPNDIKPNYNEATGAMFIAVINERRFACSGVTLYKNPIV